MTDGLVFIELDPHENIPRPTRLPPATVGSLYDHQLLIQGGSSTVTFTLSDEDSGYLPSWLALSQTGRLHSLGYVSPPAPHYLDKSHPQGDYQLSFRIDIVEDHGAKGATRRWKKQCTLGIQRPRILIEPVTLTQTSSLQGVSLLSPSTAPKIQVKSTANQDTLPEWAGPWTLHAICSSSAKLYRIQGVGQIQYQLFSPRSAIVKGQSNEFLNYCTKHDLHVSPLSLNGPSPSGRPSASTAPSDYRTMFSWPSTTTSGTSSPASSIGGRLDRKVNSIGIRMPARTQAFHFFLQGHSKGAFTIEAYTTTGVLAKEVNVECRPWQVQHGLSVVVYTPWSGVFLSKIEIHFEPNENSHHGEFALGNFALATNPASLSGPLGGLPSSSSPSVELPISVQGSPYMAGLSFPSQQGTPPFTVTAVRSDPVGNFNVREAGKPLVPGELGQTSGDLPMGLICQNSPYTDDMAFISGTPQTTGTYIVSVRVKDHYGMVGGASFLLSILPAAATGQPRNSTPQLPRVLLYPNEPLVAPQITESCRTPPMPSPCREGAGPREQKQISNVSVPSNERNLEIIERGEQSQTTEKETAEDGEVEPHGDSREGTELTKSDAQQGDNNSDPDCVEDPSSQPDCRSSDSGSSSDNLDNIPTPPRLPSSPQPYKKKPRSHNGTREIPCSPPPPPPGAPSSGYTIKTIYGHTLDTPEPVVDPRKRPHPHSGERRQLPTPPMHGCPYPYYERHYDPITMKKPSQEIPNRHRHRGRGPRDSTLHEKPLHSPPPSFPPLSPPPPSTPVSPRHTRRRSSSRSSLSSSSPNRPIPIPSPPRSPLLPFSPAKGQYITRRRHKRPPKDANQSAEEDSDDIDTGKAAWSPPPGQRKKYSNADSSVPHSNTRRSASKIPTPPSRSLSRSPPPPIHPRADKSLDRPIRSPQNRTFTEENKHLAKQHFDNHPSPKPRRSLSPLRDESPFRHATPPNSPFPFPPPVSPPQSPPRSPPESPPRSPED